MPAGRDCAVYILQRSATATHELFQDREANRMKHVEDGQCGLCAHFGETHNASEKLVQIRVTREGPEDLVDECGHPRHASLHLKVTPISGCEGFTRAEAR